MDSLAAMIWPIVIYGLGAVGLFALGALPLRAYMLTRKVAIVGFPKWIKPLTLAFFISALLLSSQFIVQLGRCLLGFHCSANAAGGWINCCFIGFIYLAFETAVWIARRLSKPYAVAT